MLNLSANKFAQKKVSLPTSKVQVHCAHIVYKNWMCVGLLLYKPEIDPVGGIGGPFPLSLMVNSVLERLLA